MHSKTVLIVVLLLSACAQGPKSFEGPVSPAPSAAPQQQIAPVFPAVYAPSPVSPPILAPRLQAAEGLSMTPPQVAMPLREPPRMSLWERIGKGYALQPMDNDLVREWETWYSSRPDYVARMIARSSRFLYHVVEEVEKRNMPMEVALLPMIESAYNPVAYSRSHASGIWQFIPSTGKDFGLRQNWWYDGRRDIMAATNAALDYLEKLHAMFGDWNLALAAYNWGEGAVGRAIERNRAKGLLTNYENLTVPPETRGYVPKLIAVKNILSNPERYGLRIVDIPNEAYFETVIIKRHIDMKVAARLAEMPLEEFKFLNPGHNKPVIKAGEGELIILPRAKALVFLSNLNKNDKPLLSWQAVTLKRAEKAEKVAALHGMTLAEFKQVNGLANQKSIHTGQTLLVPLRSGVDNPTLPDLPAAPVLLRKAIQAAKNVAQSRRQARNTQNASGGVQKAVLKSRKVPVEQLRAQSGKRVKVTVSRHSKKKAIAQPPQRQKIASR